MGCCSCTKVTPSSEPNNADQNTPTINRKRIRTLPTIETFPENHQGVSSWSPLPTQPIPAPLDRNHFDESNHSTMNIINVLLLGESGVGKSTFINAIVNYLTFDTLEEAHLKRPIALMPVSFLMTVGDHFQDRMVRFGEKDPNEDHNPHGQSVTQHCRSYVFTIGTRSKIRLIDTPGMGDTRGLDRDDLNMQHILSYIDKLPHLNAICILLKPNESKLNIVFRFCFTRLIDFLGENIRNNIIFCFTNTRGTFFAPGDTGPLLKKMLNSHSIKNIPFNKLNTFCFDSESFRYLIALEDGIKFDDDQKDEYKQSWINSVNESNRFLQYICSELKSYPKKNWQSIEHALFQINKIIRPILETIRNIHRNIILTTKISSESQIELHITPVAQSSTICSKCKRVPQQYGGFWILPDELHICSENCTVCPCSRKRHIDIHYRLDYELSNDTNKQSIDAMNQNLDQLKQVSVKFGYFCLRSSEVSEPNDPIFSLLNQMIEEENQFCQEESSECLNSRLLKKLNQFKEEYEQRRSILMSNRDPIHLTSIYELIHSVNEMNLIRK